MYHGVFQHNLIYCTPSSLQLCSINFLKGEDYSIEDFQCFIPIIHSSVMNIPEHEQLQQLFLYLFSRILLSESMHLMGLILQTVNLQTNDFFGKDR